MPNPEINYEKAIHSSYLPFIFERCLCRSVSDNWLGSRFRRHACRAFFLIPLSYLFFLIGTVLFIIKMIRSKK